MNVDSNTVLMLSYTALGKLVFIKYNGSSYIISVISKIITHFCTTPKSIY